MEAEKTKGAKCKLVFSATTGRSRPRWNSQRFALFSVLVSPEKADGFTTVPIQPVTEDLT
jgi:hypothetical protein